MNDESGLVCAVWIHLSHDLSANVCVLSELKMQHVRTGNLSYSY